ncbi:uncharacterized protein VTP21DRAFT_11029 [Calcarisporiella thermophila]|uniref:uncharacterized protein n=1 Tax=Calcarisporiella thermophila TaxID=911321 RepID=UPI003743017B
MPDSKSKAKEKKGANVLVNSNSIVLGSTATVIIFVITAAVLANLWRVGPLYMEPIYGNVFAWRHFESFFFTSCIMGAVTGLSLGAKQRKASKRTLTYAFDLAACILAISPLTVHRMFAESGLLGPWWGPHVTQLFLSYSTAFLLTLGAFSLPILRNLGAVVPAALAWWLVQNLNIVGMTCTRIVASAAGLGLLTFNIKFAAIRRDAPRKVTYYMRVCLSFIPHVIVLSGVLYSSLKFPQCQVGVTKEHNPAGSPYDVLYRNESLTGWLTVVDELEPRNIRVMRSGHSLIGGMYRDTMDSVYGCFYFLEAVRLVENRKISDKETALQIGLGIGIASKGLIEQDVEVDVVEIDAAVYDAARRYFEFPEPRAAYIEDGRKFIERTPNQTYDYVLHDVFTGGSVPASLFSVEALQEMKRTLKEDGVLALNFVGFESSTKITGLQLVANTIKHVFEHVLCFREGPSQGEDQVQNMVFFASRKPISFRSPTYDDFLESGMRQHMLTEFKNWAVDIKFNTSQVITDRDNPLPALQLGSAYEHWRVMRENFPISFWLNY